jgi:sugar/nucleoside kinase (ribokinase family)
VKDLLCVGNAVADAVARPVKTTPKLGQLQFVDRIGLFAGGCGLNTASAAARMGLKTGIVTGVGKDGFGDFILGRLKDAGVDVSSVIVDKTRHSSATLVSVASDGERGFLHTAGASASLNDKSAPDSLLKRYRALHLSGYYLLPNLDGPPSARLLKRASGLGLYVSLDTSWDPQARLGRVLACLPFVDAFMPSYEEAVQIFKTPKPPAIAKLAFKAGVRKLVILKVGAKGCEAFTPSGTHLSVPAIKVKAVDATGAGDAFDAGFLTGLLKGKSLPQSLALGCAAGAACVAGLGAAGNLKSYAQVEKLARELKV